MRDPERRRGPAACRRPCGCRTGPGPYQVALADPHQRDAAPAASAGRRCRRPSGRRRAGSARTAALGAARRSVPLTAQRRRSRGRAGSAAACATSSPVAPSPRTRSPELRGDRAAGAGAGRGRPAASRRRPCRRARSSPRAGSGRSPSTNAQAATRSGREPGMSCASESACCARWRARAALEASVRHVPLFPALTGLADGLALKELRYAARLVARGDSPPRPVRPPLVPPLSGALRRSRRLSGQVCAAVLSIWSVCATQDLTPRREARHL